MMTDYDLAPFLGGDASAAARLKVATLCHGLEFPLDMFQSVKKPFYDNQYVYGRTSRDVVRSHLLPQALRLGHGAITAVLRRESSPWGLDLLDDQVIVRHQGNYVRDLELPDRPAYFGKVLSDGQRSEDFIAVAGEVTPGFFVYPDCHYFPDGRPCKFCSLKHARKTAGKTMASRFDLGVVAEATQLFQQTKWKNIPIISITTGTFPNNDEGALYTSRIVRAIYDALDPKIPIHVLTMPPDTLDLIGEFRDAGATSIAFNLEVFDRDAFVDICPGKQHSYGYEKMLDALVHAADVFGSYNAFCGFVWGLEPVNSVVAGYRWCLDRNISVSSNVFHSDQGSVFAKRAHPTEDFVLALCSIQSNMYKEYPDARSIFPVSMRSTLDWEIYRGDFR
jgi:hypothetical protein